MIPADAATLARKIMDEFGLESWKFAFDRSLRRFGACHWVDSKITLSRALVALNDRDTVEDTIRHEVAHALAPWQSNHDDAWKAQCAITGARPDECYGDSVTLPDIPAKCALCRRQESRRNPLQVSAGVWNSLALCSSCVKHVRYCRRRWKWDRDWVWWTS